MFAVERPSTTTAAADAANDDFAVRLRLDSFKLGKVAPPSFSMGPHGAAMPGHKHKRSHSRNASISSTPSISLSVSSSRSSGFNDLSSFSFGSLSASSSASTMSSSGSTPSVLSNSGPASAPVAPSKRNSHHRRRSSVSTRRESAELMGVSLPDLPSASLEDNVNFGDKDSIRRRALWALEGKHDVSFSKVEIPELSTPNMEKMMFDLSATKPTLSGGLPTGFGNSMMGSKRDSFKLLSASGSSKDQLGTLMEEEEEEEEDSEPRGKKDPQDSLPSPTTSVEGLPAVTPSPVVAVTKPTPVRPRPATLNLRPLSLTPDNLGSSGLPTPTLTPSPRSGLRSLSLASAGEESATPEAKRIVASRRPVLNLSMDSASDDSSPGDYKRPPRRSSISYRSSSQSSMAGLPTPEMTPILSRRCSVSESIRSSKSGDDEFFPPHPSYRPLSASEQHFLYKSHNALLARITDLEKALSMRRSSMGGYSISGMSRPSSVLSDASLPSELSSPASGEPSDEMLALIRDLKEERDELKKDVDGWRTRVADLDKQLVLVAKRVENERKEAWVARSRVGLLEAEKAALDKRLLVIDQVVAGLETEKTDLESRNSALKKENEAKSRRIEELEAELENIKGELESERARKHRPQAPSDVTLDGDDLMATPTPQSFDGQNRWRVGLGFSSNDSEDISMGSFNFGLPSQGAEGDGYEGEYSDEEDALAGYEDEDDVDLELDTSSSFGSLSDFSQRTPVQSDHVPEPSIPSRPAHRSRHSLSKVWTFPKVTPTLTAGQDSRHKASESVDKFFNCMDESDASDESGPVTPMLFNYEESKGIFASGFKYADDDDAPFYLPGGVGTVVEEPVSEFNNDRKLSAVHEEEEEEADDKLSDMEDDEDMFGEIAGIRIMCTPPDDVEEAKEVEQIQFISPVVKQVSTPPTLPAFDFGHDEGEEESFSFGRSPLAKESSVVSAAASKSTTPASPRSTPSMITPPSSIPRLIASRAASPPSAIPRPSSRTSTISSPPQRSFSSFVTPPTKRGGTSPSFIPQPVMSPTPSRVSSSRPKSAVPGPTFIRPPTRTNPLTPPSPNTHSSKPRTTPSTNEQETMNDSAYRSPKSSFQDAVSRQQHRSAYETNMKSVDLRYSPIGAALPSPAPTSPVSSILPSSASSKLPFSFSNYIPLPWSSRSPETVSSPVSQVERKATFVSREQQLLKLKNRMEVEGAGMSVPPLHCRRCDVHRLVEL